VNDLTFFMSPIVFTFSFFAVDVSSPNESVSENGVMRRSVPPRSASTNVFAAEYVAAAVFGSGFFAMFATSTPSYSG
jgi:hypothetical protein